MFLRGLQCFDIAVD